GRQSSCMGWGFAGNSLQKESGLTWVVLGGTVCPMKKISLYLDAKTIKQLRDLSEVTNVPQARILRSFIMHGLKNPRLITKPTKESIGKGAKKAMSQLYKQPKSPFWWFDCT